jgi:hypothetical protein
MTAMTNDSAADVHRRMMPRQRSVSREVLLGRSAEQEIIRDLLRRAQRGRAA